MQKSQSAAVAIFDATGAGGPAGSVEAAAWTSTGSVGSHANSTLPDYLYYYTSPGTAAKIEASQLGRRGELYLTTRGDLTDVQAQIELALPPTNSGAVVYQVDTRGMDPLRVLMARRVTGNVYRRGGGGIEVNYSGTVTPRLREGSALTDSIRLVLDQLVDRHSGDFDGGYALADELAWLLKSDTLGDETRNELIRWILNATSPLWAVALEAFVSQPDLRARSLLEGSFNAVPPDRRDQLAVDLARMGSESDLVRRHLMERIGEGDTGLLPGAAAMGTRDQIVRRYAARRMARWAPDRPTLENVVPAFVRSFVPADVPALADWLSEGIRDNPEGGRLLLRWTRDYLHRPYVIAELGDAAAVAERAIAGLG